MVNVLTLLKLAEEKVLPRYVVGPYYVVPKWCYCLWYDVICLPVRVWPTRFKK